MTVPFWAMAELADIKGPPSGVQVSLEDMVSGTGKLVDGELSSYSAHGTYFERGDVLFGRLRPYLAKVWHADAPGTAGGDILVFRPTKRTDSAFLSYVALSQAFIGHTSAAVTGTKMPRVGWHEIRTISVPDFSREEQRRIAEFLDRETAEIDAMDADLDRLIDTLQERRGAIINLSITQHGRMATAPFWSFAELAGMKGPPAGTQVSLEDMVSGTGKLVEDELANYSAEGTYFERGDILFGRLRPYLAKVWQAKEPGTAGGDILVFRPTDSTDSRFLFYVSLSQEFIGRTSAAVTGTKMPRVSWHEIRTIPVPALPLDEQRRIADRLDRETAGIDSMIEDARLLKEVLAERRSVLISDVVTGRKEVPV